MSVCMLMFINVRHVHQLVCVSLICITSDNEMGGSLKTQPQINFTKHNSARLKHNVLDDLG